MPSKIVYEGGRTVWRARAYALDTSSGKVRERTKVFDRKADALDWEAGQRRKRGHDPRLGQIRLADYIRDNMEKILYGLAVSTETTYRGHLLLRIVPALGHLRLVDLRPADIEQAQARWAQSISVSAVLGTRNCLSRVLQAAIREGRIETNPVVAALRPKQAPTRPIETLTLAEAAELITLCRAVSDLYGDYAQLAFATGLRAGELLALQVRDVDLGTRQIHVQRAWSGTGAGRQIQTPKNGRTRRVPVTVDVVPLLAARIAGASRAAWLWRGPNGGQLWHANFRARVDWTQLVADLGHPGFRFHSLRATAIVSWIKAGVPLTTVRDWAGHASLATTNIYAQVARSDFSDAVQLLDSYRSRTSDDPRREA